VTSLWASATLKRAFSFRGEIVQVIWFCSGFVPSVCRSVAIDRNDRQKLWYSADLASVGPNAANALPELAPTRCCSNACPSWTT
jgi:hypothetical protein